jgi:hypothetical protein
LGRPFALSDKEIDVDLPMNVDEDMDEESKLISALESPESVAETPPRTSLSYHRYHIQLYQIHTQIRLTLHQMRKSQTKELAQQRVSSLLAHLEEWRTQVLRTFDLSSIETRASRGRTRNSPDPSAESDSEGSSFFGTDDRSAEIEKTELLLEYHKARRSLLQPLMTETRDSYQFSQADYIACAEASGQICQLYRRLHRLSPVPFSLRDLHAVFVAGFTLIYCICMYPTLYSASRTSDVGACSTVLYIITEQWSGARKYRDAFEVVAEKMIESAAKFQEAAVYQRPAYPSSEILHSPVSVMAPSRPVPNISYESYSQQTSPSSAYSTLGHPDGINGSSEVSSSTRVMHDSNITGLLNPTGNIGLLNIGLEINLDTDMYDIEGLLSTEGLDWFTGAVL